MPGLALVSQCRKKNLPVKEHQMRFYCLEIVFHLYKVSRQSRHAKPNGFYIKSSQKKKRHSIRSQLFGFEFKPHCFQHDHFQDLALTHACIKCLQWSRLCSQTGVRWPIAYVVGSFPAIRSFGMLIAWWV